MVFWLALSTVVWAEETCLLPDFGEPTRPTAVHLVVGPLPINGDPRLIHHLEHLTAESPPIRCALSRGAELDAFTSPDTMHLLWRGLASDRDAALVAELLVQGIQAAGSTSWQVAADEIAVERAIHEPSASELLVRNSSDPSARYRLDLRGAVAPDLPAALAEVAASPVTVFTAVHHEPVRWTTTLSPPSATPELVRRAPTPGASEVWQVQGVPSCLERRAVWAALEGLAEATQGSAIGWWGRDSAVLAIADSARPLNGRVVRAAVQPALDYDRAAVLMTRRRARDVGDRSWMAAGALGLGVCPATVPLTADDIRAALGRLRTGGPLEPLEDSASGELAVIELPVVEWAAVWQAGTPPADWTNRPGEFHTRTPGGFTVDGPAAGFEAPPAPVSRLASLKDGLLEQVLAVLGAREREVSCQGAGLVGQDCLAAGALRVPTDDAVVVVDRAEVLRVLEVRALPPGTGALATQRFDPVPELAGMRGYRHTVEPGRSVRAWSVSADEDLQLLGQELWTAPASTARAARLAARPWEAVHQPRSKAAPDAVQRLEAAPVVTIIEGPSEVVLARLKAQGIAVDRVWLPAQLTAEADAIRGPRDPPPSPP